jgi:hypothetical protein
MDIIIFSSKRSKELEVTAVMAYGILYYVYRENLALVTHKIRYNRHHELPKYLTDFMLFTNRSKALAAKETCSVEWDSLAYFYKFVYFILA